MQNALIKTAYLIAGGFLARLRWQMLIQGNFGISASYIADSLT